MGWSSAKLMSSTPARMGMTAATMEGALSSLTAASASSTGGRESRFHATFWARLSSQTK